MGKPRPGARAGGAVSTDPVPLQAWVHPQRPHRLPALLGQTGDPWLRHTPDPACVVLSQPAGGLCGAVCGTAGSGFVFIWGAQARRPILNSTYLPDYVDGGRYL